MDKGIVLKKDLHNLKIELDAFLSITLKVGKKAKIRNRYTQMQHLTKDTVWESDKYTITHHMLESQEIITRGLKLVSRYRPHL